MRGSGLPVSLPTRLPRLRIPLAPSDPDAVLDLQKVFERTYENGAYGRTVDYTRAIEPVLSAADGAWASRFRPARYSRRSRRPWISSSTSPGPWAIAATSRRIPPGSASALLVDARGLQIELAEGRVSSAVLGLELAAERYTRDATNYWTLRFYEPLSKEPLRSPEELVAEQGRELREKDAQIAALRRQLGESRL